MVVSEGLASALTMQFWVFLPLNLIQEWADEGSGATRFGLSDTVLYHITPEHFTGTPNPPHDYSPASPVDKSLSDLPSWVRSQSHWTVQQIAGPPHTAHLYVHTYLIST
jgi:hypothetical protein